MKTIGIIVTIEEELALMKSKMEIISAKNIIGADFFMGKTEKKNLVLVRSDMGKISAAICTQVLIDFYGVDCVISTGIAGAVSNELCTYGIVVGQDFVQHDFDASSLCTGSGAGKKTGDRPDLYAADEELYKIAWEAASLALPERKLSTGRIATGDRFVTDKAEKKCIGDKFKACCVEMEGAAVAQTCTVNKIPFAVIRTIVSGELSDRMFLEIAKGSSLIVEQMSRMI